jgi:hypothetical protein
MNFGINVDSQGLPAICAAIIAFAATAIADERGIVA